MAASANSDETPPYKATPECSRPAYQPISEAEAGLVEELKAMVSVYQQLGNPLFGKYYQYVLEHGRFFTPAGRPKGTRRGKRNACFGNAQMLAFDNRALTYTERFA